MKKVSDAADLFDPAMTNLLAKYGKPPELPISFLPTLNEKIWGLPKKSLVVVGGRPSQGKSALLLQMAYSLATAGKRVVFISLEMSLETCILRLFNAECEIDNWVNCAGLSMMEKKKKQVEINAFQEALSGMHFVFIEGYGKNFDELTELVEGFDIDVDAVFIDYIQMTRMSGNTDKQAIDEYIKKLRAYAQKRNFCAVIGSQINRSTHEGKFIKKPEMHELKGTGVLDEATDLLFLVHWGYWYDKDVPRNDYWIRVAKNRNGRTGSFDCTYEPEYFRIKEKYTKDGKLQVGIYEGKPGESA